jgi:hypothetical protein
MAAAAAAGCASSTLNPTGAEALAEAEALAQQPQLSSADSPSSRHWLAHAGSDAARSQRHALCPRCQILPPPVFQSNLVWV